MKFKRFYISLTVLFIVFFIVGIFAKEPSSAPDLNSSSKGQQETIKEIQVSGSGESQ